MISSSYAHTFPPLLHNLLVLRDIYYLYLDRLPENFSDSFQTYPISVLNDIYPFDQKGIWQLKSTNIASWQPHFEPHRIWSEWKLTYRQYTNTIYDLSYLLPNEIIFTWRFNVPIYDKQIKEHNIIWKGLKSIIIILL